MNDYVTIDLWKEAVGKRGQISADLGFLLLEAKQIRQEGVFKFPVLRTWPRFITFIHQVIKTQAMDPSDLQIAIDWVVYGASLLKTTLDSIYTLNAAITHRWVEMQHRFRGSCVYCEVQRPKRGPYLEQCDTRLAMIIMVS